MARFVVVMPDWTADTVEAGQANIISGCLVLYDGPNVIAGYAPNDWRKFTVQPPSVDALATRYTDATHAASR